MSKLRRNIVEIVNPLPGGAPYTTWKSAHQFVRRGLAVFEAGGNAIRFLNQERRTNNGEVRDRIGGEFWWRMGMTGGMVQQIGSIVFPVHKAGKAKRSL